MTSQAEIRALIDETEAKYRECWTTLARFKELVRGERRRGSEAADLRKDLLDFQPKLGRALFELSEMYRTLHQEKRAIVAKKERLSPEWFKRRLTLIKSYQETLKTVMAIGKCLGDSFAWFFYEGERRYLPEHYKLDWQLQTPPGVGALGEIEFISSVQVLRDHLILYHGITTFLRLGDVSFIDLKSLEVTAIGELKTRACFQSHIQRTIAAMVSIAR